jgi:predicted metalloprotease with PDZ domain
MFCRRYVLPLLLLATSAFAQRAPIQITADLSDAPRKLFHAEVDIPVTAGPLTLTTPKWIPGSHSPSGPVADITGVVFTANGKPLPWRRDDVDLYQFHLTIPAGVSSVHVHVDCIVTSTTNNLAVLEWERLMVYPAGIPVREIPIQASVNVPAGWGIGTSLTPISTYDPQHPAGGMVHYAATTVEMLEDSPIMTGAFFHEYPLAPEITPKHFIDVFGDSPEVAEIRPTVLDHWNRLVHEALAMYGAPHYRSYHFLLTLRGEHGGGGLEHHESSDNNLPENALTTDDGEMISADLLPHEFTHSWNGKYRRPVGLATSDYSQPMKGDLLWVYEGLTDYLGDVLGTRCGAISPEHYRQSLALDAATMDNTMGRQWRSIGDTAISASMFRGSGGAWANWRRSQDYYPEGNLLWLDVDTTIRKLTNNSKNLRDFMTVYLNKGGDGTPTVVPYDFDELVNDLNEVVKYDWARFLNDRVNGIHPHVNLEGIEQGGYKLVYTDKPSEYQKARLAGYGAAIDVWFSLGIALDNDGTTIRDVRVGGPADKARFIPGEKIMAVNGRVYSKDALHVAIKHSRTSSTPIHFILQNATFVAVADVDYHGGERYPTLERVEGTPDYLDDIARPLANVGSSAAGGQ